MHGLIAFCAEIVYFTMLFAAILTSFNIEIYCLPIFPRLTVPLYVQIGDDGNCAHFTFSSLHYTSKTKNCQIPLPCDYNDDNISFTAFGVNSQGGFSKNTTKGEAVSKRVGRSGQVPPRHAKKDLNKNLFRSCVVQGTGFEPAR